ncbi:class I SAM-dependent methyltransferase [Pedobacter sp. BS3]|uniref:class I SAM-dependent methyltransferase n=1 Tax=Pedobacter sp. BS3 TaxID=2567937 RepID=UPI0011EC96CD|nr:class I SAM-dependent methyltransferase [Pedobacter sp. BS3]
MDKETGSATAIGAAMLRAAHQLIDGHNKLLDDPVILRLINPEAPEYIRQHSEYFYHPKMMALRTHIVLRSRYAEDCLKQAVDRGIRQYLILGAGLDTFAYRQPGWADELMITEADHPASQAEKLLKLRQAHVSLPENLNFITIDLESDEWTTALDSCIDFTKPLFIACLGVMVYLSRKAVDRIFRFVAALPQQSEIVFTMSQHRDQAPESITAARAAALGEPWITHINHDELSRQLYREGFSSVTFLSPNDAYKMYFMDNHVQIPVPQRSSIGRAVV